MAPFVFPDPSTTTTATNPATGDVYIYQDGVWMITDPDDPDGSIQPAPPSTDAQIMTALRTEIAALKTDIIELKAQITSASTNNFLVLE
tara:strand:- start:3489 stop:3755 length:267 start_codon:yes stop_codon:yes gene_type:complete